MLELPPIDAADVPRWVEANLTGLYSGAARRSAAFVGGQSEANRAIDGLNIAGYAKRRSSVHPPASRGASNLSPYIRHGLLDLPTVHEHPAVAEANSYDRFRYRGELLWQDYSRQWYAAFGTQTRVGTVYDPAPGKSAARWDREPWPRDMKCVDATLTELHDDGWIVNQARMWLASQWSVRAGADWRSGDDEMFRHLLDGSRAANRQGWQWVVGGTRNRSYGFARRQVMKRAAQFCDDCALSESCPIGGYPGSVAGDMIDPAPTMSVAHLTPPDPATAEPRLFDAVPTSTSGTSSEARPDAVWITAESLGDGDPALVAHPELPVHFVFDEPLLDTLQLDGKRLVFLADCLSDLAQRRDLTVWRGRPVELFEPTGEAGADRRFAVTRAPVPGFDRITTGQQDRLELSPWPWLRPPTPKLLDRLGAKRFPSFKDWCRLTKPDAVDRPIAVQ